jgi:hypothetical protein
VAAQTFGLNISDVYLDRYSPPSISFPVRQQHSAIFSQTFAYYTKTNTIALKYFSHYGTVEFGKL